MSKCIEILETPYCCGTCTHRYEAERMSVGHYTYQTLFRCNREPEIEDYDEQEEFDPYINDYMNSKGRPDWCPLRVLTDEEFNKVIELLGDVEVIDYDR